MAQLPEVCIAKVKEVFLRYYDRWLTPGEIAVAGHLETDEVVLVLKKLAPSDFQFRLIGGRKEFHPV